jgi:hypothetical protein
MPEALSERWVDCVFADISLNSIIVSICTLVFLQWSSLDFVLMRGIPCAKYNFSTSAHGLTVTAHHADGAKVMQNIFCRDSFGPDTRFGEGNIFRDILGQVVTDHQHI